MAPVQVTPEQVVAFRLAQHGLATWSKDPFAAFAGWTIQDSPPGAATAATLARTNDLPAGWVDDALADRSVVALYNARTATALVPAADAAAYATSMLPNDDGDDDALKAILGRAVPEQDAGFAKPVALAVDAISELLDGEALSRDDLHEGLRGTLPKALLPWCDGCQSHHARRGLLVMASLHGRLCISGRAGRQPLFARTDQLLGGWKPSSPDEAGAELVRRFVRAYGPTTRQEFQRWAGLGTAHARTLWESVADELTEIVVAASGSGDAQPVPGWILSDDTRQLSRPKAAKGVRILGPGDPLLVGRDREVLVPDAAVRKRLWSALPTVGLVVADGQPVATWKASKKSKRLDVKVDAFADAPETEIETAFERVAPHRGCETASVSWA